MRRLTLCVCITMLLAESMLFGASEKSEENDPIKTAAPAIQYPKISVPANVELTLTFYVRGHAPRNAPIEVKRWIRWLYVSAT